MGHLLVFKVFLLSMTLLFIKCVYGSTTATTVLPDPEEQMIKNIIKECTESKSRLMCFSEKAAIALERSMNWDIPLFDGIVFARNNDKIPSKTQRDFGNNGYERLTTAITNFLDTHTVKLDLTEDLTTKTSARQGREGEEIGHHGHKDHSHKEMKKEKKYMQYAFMVLLGIFGLTGPLVMKTLAIIAAKALIASKVALIIVGSVALKKIFEKDHHDHSSVKVHTISDDDTDRLYNTGYYNQPYYTPYDGWSKPT